jgi:hypothetical protein
MAVAFQPYSSAWGRGERGTWVRRAHFLRLQSVQDRVGFGRRRLDGTSRCGGVSALIFVPDLQDRGSSEACVDIKVLHCLAYAQVVRLGCDFLQALAQPGLPFAASDEKLFLPQTFVRQ